jgi:hypothetical protein
MNRVTTGISQSVKTRLLDHAKAAHVDPNHVLARYATERFIYRLSCSQHRAQFVLKGAMLLIPWLGDRTRPTRDADMLALGEFDDDALSEIFADACMRPGGGDGMEFDAKSVKVSPILDGAPYGGERVTIRGWLGNVRLRVQVDVALGDATAPSPQWIVYPSLLDLPRPWILAYHPATSIAEKAHTIVTFGNRNTRMKDFFDVCMLAKRMSFEGDALSAAIRTTFARRRTPVPSSLAEALPPDFADRERQRQWVAYFKTNRLQSVPYELADVMREVGGLLDPVFHATHSRARFNARWDARGPWRP